MTLDYTHTHHSRRKLAEKVFEIIVRTQRNVRTSSSHSTEICIVVVVVAAATAAGLDNLIDG